ncbi:MAG: hypothetical protein HZC55_03990 [Verrucomicrobia bacterium]|nr:hypothetical protein [Verrucomicrobiota bacterium]
MSRILRFSTLGFLIALLAGCGKHDHDHKPAGGGHAHTAPHGGTLVEIGAHAYNLELLTDPATGRLSAWVLDGHAENFVRVKAPALEATVDVGGSPRALSLKAVANPATGETVGDTSQFEAQADWLKGVNRVQGSVASIEIRGTKFGPLAFKAGPAAPAAAPTQAAK